jgi:phosphoenolpyruvate carboxylase
VDRTEIEFPPRHAALRDDVHMLGGLVGEVLRDQGGEPLLQLVERDRQLAIARRRGDAAAGQELESRMRDRPTAVERDLERAFTAWFQAVNLAEQLHRVRRRRAYFLDDGGKPQPGGVADAIGRLKAAGLTLDEVVALLGSLHIEPVFMAHPADSPRRTVLR